MIHYLLHQIALTCAPGSIPVDNICQSTSLPVVDASHVQLEQILTITFGIVAALSVLFIVVGGLRFVLSEGDPQATARARSTMLYAIVGLLIAITAEAIVAFVLNRL